MNFLTVNKLIKILDKKENRQTARGAERIIGIQINGEFIGYIKSAKMDGWGSGLVADVCLEIETDLED